MRWSAISAIDDVVGNAVERQWCSNFIWGRRILLRTFERPGVGTTLGYRRFRARDGYQRGVWSERSISNQ